MRLRLAAAVIAYLHSPGLHAQDQQQSDENAKTKAVEEVRKQEQAKEALRQARERQKAVERRNLDLWNRWTYAVCIGCSWTPRKLRIVHTYPLRVLMGIPAAEDDARERRGRRVMVLLKGSSD